MEHQTSGAFPLRYNISMTMI